MPDYKVTFRGDLGNLAQFDAAVRNSALASARAIENANTRIASSVAKITGAYSNTAGAGYFARNQKAMADSINNTFRHSADVVRRFVADYEVQKNKLTGKFEATPIFGEAYQSSIKKTIGNLEAYQIALKRVERSEAQLMAARRQFAGVGALSQNLKTGLTGRRGDVLARQKADTRLGNLASLTNITQQDYDAAAAVLAQTKPGTRGIVQLRKQVQELEKTLQQAKTQLAAARRPYEQEIERIDRAMDKLGQRVGTAGTRLADTERRILSRRGYKDLDIAANATPPIQSDLARVLQESPELRKRLLAGGLGGGTQYGTSDFQRALAAQEASVNSYTRNLRTNVRTVQGEFRDARGMMNNFTVDLDDQGKVIGRWGGQLGGAGSILRQTVRDFQKVIEWTVATTLVFGTLATVVGQLQNINELNTLLTRFSVTAQTSATETNEFFSQLTQVAINTATPLKEIITVADDIALATREAGDSTDVWRGKILDLTTAVGIFTNLTGKDTVAAADQLSSTFKQLDIAPNELIGVLNKITAVAGGQANAIADILQSVSGLAEAARAAGFTVDEQIAAVQVLAQVTNKTSAEVATAFKNLFGSVSSVGSEKILSQFGIQVRDASGGVRDFLDIYRDVARALEQGIIPQNRLPDVIRGISGGPRRAPDAAVLLANIGRIDDVVQRSQGATNEALIANARILDTNQAKIIQFQNAIDAAVFEEFGQAVRELTSVLTDFGIAFASVLGGLPEGFVSTALKVGILTGALLTFVKVLGLLSRGLGITSALSSLRRLSTGFKETALQAEASAIAADVALAKRFPTVAGQAGVFTGGPARQGNFLQRNRLALGVGAAAIGGAAVGNVAGAGASDFGTALQAGGLLVSFIPGLQAVGIAATIAGTAIQFFSDSSDEAKKSTADLSKEVYDLTQQVRSTQDEANQYSDAQKAALKTIQALQSDTSRTADEQSRLSTATQEYVTATLGLAAANREVSATFDDILQKIPNLAVKYQSFKNLAASGIGGEDFKRLQSLLATDILRGTGQAIYGGQQLPLATGFRQGVTGTQTQITGSFGNKIAVEDIIENPERLRDIFRLAGQFAGSRDVITGDIRGRDPRFGKLDVPERLTEGTVRAIQSGLAQALESFQRGEGTFTQEELDLLIKAVGELTVAASSFTQNAAALSQQGALIQARTLTGEFTAQQGQQAGVANTLAQQLNQALGQYKPQFGREGEQILSPAATSSIDTIAQLAEAANQGLAVSNSLLVQAATNTLKLTGEYQQLAVAGEEAINFGIIDFLKNAGVEQDILNQLAVQYNLTLQQTAAINEELSISLAKARDDARQTFADRSLQLLIAENSGEFEKNAAGLATLKEQNQEAYDSSVALIDAIGQLSQTSFVDLSNSLSNVIGLQGQFISQTELNRVATMEAAEQSQYWSERMSTLGTQLIENAVKAGVNAEGIKKIKDEVLKLIGAIIAIPPYKQIIIDLKTRLQSPGVSGPSSLSTAAGQIKELEKQQKAGDASATSQINAILKQINKIIGSGGGSTLGQLPRAGSAPRTRAAPAYNPPGLLDIPPEVLLQSNGQQLIQQAIQKARNLQSKIPGATGANKSEIVELLNGTKRVLEVRGVGEEFLRRAMDELRDEIKRQNDLLSKADTIRRIRVGGGDFSAIANVPINSKSGVSVGGLGGPISVSLDVNGTVFTPAQLSTFADMVAAALKRQLSG